MKKLLLLIFCISSGLSFGQVTGVDYLMKYNCETNQYDVSIVVLNGSATSIVHRAQFNSQISIAVPTGEAIEITDAYMPLQNNQTYTGTAPIIWFLGNPTVSPAAQPENDFYGLTPTLSPASFYNNMEEGDIIKLFSFTAGETGQYDENVRFFNNNEDPKSNEPGMGGSNFSNGFTIGGSIQLYNDNVEESCVTGVNEELAQITNVYPNPFQNQFTIEVPEDAKNIYILGANGKLFYQSSVGDKEIITVNANDFVDGVYFVRIESNSGIFTSTRIVKL